jgi:hypothetical protein
MKYPLIIFTATALLSISCAGSQESAQYQRVPRMPAMHTWSDEIADWPEPSRKAAREMGQKYGAPHEITETQLVWYEHGPWKRAVLSREGTPHDWPSPHVDVLEQVVDLRVDPKRADDIARFDGSVIIERTKGELSARCGGEAANFLAINLARDIATGKRTVEDARSFYEQAMAAASTGQKPPEMEQLMFAQAPGKTGDRDRADKQAARRKPKPVTEQSSKGTALSGDSAR